MWRESYGASRFRRHGPPRSPDQIFGWHGRPPCLRRQGVCEKRAKWFHPRLGRGDQRTLQNQQQSSDQLSSSFGRQIYYPASCHAAQINSSAFKKSSKIIGHLSRVQQISDKCVWVLPMKST